MDPKGKGVDYCDAAPAATGAAVPTVVEDTMVAVAAAVPMEGDGGTTALPIALVGAPQSDGTAGDVPQSDAAPALPGAVKAPQPVAGSGTKR